MKTTKSNLGASLRKLKEIVDWFDAQDEIDVEAGLEKVRESTALIKESRTRLKEIENEFEEVKKSLNPES